LFLKKLRIVSNASRNIKKLTSFWFERKNFKQLTWRKYSNSGRNDSGRTVVWTKSSLKIKIIRPVINYSMRSRVMSFITTFKLIPFQNKLVSLSFLASGGVTYLPVTDLFKIFDFLYFSPKRNSLKPYLPEPSLFLLYSIKRLSKVSLLELFPGAGIQYVRSSGTCARLIKMDFNSHTAVLQLPSGVRKTFSIYSLASLGQVALKNKRLLANTKSGYWRSFGLKPIVRGVARNPVDHPHGGRTKSIKYPRTPWGKTTKFK